LWIWIFFSIENMRHIVAIGTWSSSPNLLCTFTWTNDFVFASMKLIRHSVGFMCIVYLSNIGNQKQFSQLQEELGLLALDDCTVIKWEVVLLGFCECLSSLYLTSTTFYKVSWFYFYSKYWIWKTSSFMFFFFSKL